MNIRIYWILLAVLFATSCTNRSDENKDQDADTDDIGEVSAIPQINEIFPQLYDSLHAQDPQFDPSLFEEGPVFEKPDSLALNMDKGELNSYLPYLIFNQDSSFALDLVSYNYVPTKTGAKVKLEELGPDYEVGLVDMNSHKRKQLLFFGTTGTILDARWLDKNTLLMAGGGRWNNPDSLNIDLYRYSVTDKLLQKYSYPEAIHADWSKYPRYWMEEESSDPSASTEHP
jgi:hypothetical protein